MSKWVKFKDQTPPENMPSLWLYDGEIVCHGHPLFAIGHDGYTHWMERPLAAQPSPPEREKHCCSYACHDHVFEAYESESVFHPELILKINRKMDWKGFQVSIPIEFCPFCGFTLEKK